MALAWSILVDPIEDLKSLEGSGVWGPGAMMEGREKPGVNAEGAMRDLRIATLDEDPTTRQLIRHWLMSGGHQVVDVVQGAQLPALLEALPDIVCLDVSFDRGQGLRVLQEIHTLVPHLAVIVLGAPRDSETVVAAMRAGAQDYLSKPLDPALLRRAVERAARLTRLSEARDLSYDVRAGTTLFGPLVGTTQAARQLEVLVTRVIERDVVVCLDAERGAGAGLLAAAIHRGGARRGGPFVEIDCAALPPDEQYRSLFGEESARGVLSRGAFERASGGVLFLRQVGQLDLKAQATMAQCIAQKAVRRFGGHDPLPVNVRIVAAHEGDLRVLVRQGRVREDLYFRLAVYPIRVPPLRERREDIPAIATHFLRQLAPGDAPVLAPETLEALMRYSWPGNIRELEHVVHRSLLTAQTETIEFSDLPEQLRRELAQEGPISSRRARGGAGGAFGMTFPENEVVPLRDLERRAIEHALRVTGGSVSLAAQKLGIGRATLYRRIASLDLALNVA